MLKSIDVLIGLSVIMLAASMAAMIMTQALVALSKRRGSHLLDGVTDLIGHLDPSLLADESRRIAKTVLLQPLVRGSKRRSATVIKREELLKLLFELSLPPAANADPSVPTLPDAVRTRLQQVLAANGIANPAQTLSNVRMLALELERSHPEMATAARQTMALTQEAHSEFVAKVNSWFDHTMDRVTERFTVSTRVITFLCAVVLVVVTQLDSIGLINRLAMDDGARNALVEEAIRVNDIAGKAQADAEAAAAKAAEAKSTQAPPAQEQPGQTPPAPAEPTPAVPAQTQSAATASLLSEEDQRRVVRIVKQTGILQIPTYSGGPKDWFTEWKKHLQSEGVSGAGMLLSIMMISLGAPFWFNALSGLLRLRSVVAQKDDADRAVRQSDSQPPPAGAGARGAGVSVAADAAPPSAVAGERGDLTAVG